MKIKGEKIQKYNLTLKFAQLTKHKTTTKNNIVQSLLPFLLQMIAKWNLMQKKTKNDQISFQEISTWEHVRKPIATKMKWTQIAQIDTCICVKVFFPRENRGEMW